MKKNIDRLKHFGAFSSPTPDDMGYQEVMDFHQKQIQNNPKRQKELKKNFEKASSILYTQLKNGIGFVQDKELRFFLEEFNDRAWKYGFGAMPSSFNVLEGFFKWIPDIFLFELMEEEEHLFSIFDYFDFVTSDNCSASIEHFIDNVEDEVIYTYNILNDVKDLSFSTSDSKDYVFGGVSFIKRDNEVFMLLVAGEIGDVDEISKNLPDMENGTMTKSFIKPAEERKKEAVKLFDRKDIWKVNVYVRIDLESKTIDSRYIQKDTGNAYSTITDDYGMLERSIKDKKILDEVAKNQVKEISTYDAIFEAAYNFLFLPEYFNYYDKEVVIEEHPTELLNEKLKRPILSKNPDFSSTHFIKNREVWVLDRNIDLESGKTFLRKSELKIEKGGYWQRLDPGKIGKDKNGNKIHSRTWVEKTLSWHETVISDKEVEINIPKTVSHNKGYIYIMRNPAHELDIFKIGLTTKTVEDRAKQLSGTPSPDQFLIVHRWLVDDCVIAEKLIHEKLENYRINSKREFFKINLEYAIKEIIPIVEKINNTSK